MDAILAHRFQRLREMRGNVSAQPKVVSATRVRASFAQSAEGIRTDVDKKLAPVAAGAREGEAVVTGRLTRGRERALCNRETALIFPIVPLDISARPLRDREQQREGLLYDVDIDVDPARDP
jgi:hypothetical protein